ncbi:MAG: M20/M25/M40 family metallo-hydrolase [Chloroflexota bacterium]|nr:M20/M25/M40 family metallo-hydrolase [Chloroflexota bacterium]
MRPAQHRRSEPGDEGDGGIGQDQAGEGRAEVRLIPVDDGPPVVFAEMGEGERTLLIYNHYDVQPPEPLDEWGSPPFEPTVRKGKLFARGVADDKGDLTARIQGIKFVGELVRQFGSSSFSK